MRKLIAAACAVALSTQLAAAQTAPARSNGSAGQAIDTLVQQGLGAASRSDWPTATLRFTQAHLLAPDNPVPLYNLGIAHASANHPTAAIAWLEAYLAAAPQSANAERIRVEIGRLRQLALDTMREYCETAETAVQQLRGDERGRQRSSISYGCGISAMALAPVEDDSIRTRLASVLKYEGAYTAARGYLDRLTDTTARDNGLSEVAQALAAGQRYAEAREWASAISNPAKRTETLTTILQTERAAQADTAMFERIRAGSFPTQPISTYLSKGRGYRWFDLAEQLARSGFYRELLELATTPHERAEAVAEIAAVKLRSGDFDGARRHARELLASAPVPRGQIVLAADAVRRAADGQGDAAITTVMSRISHVALQSHALTTIAQTAKTQQNGALEQRASQLASQLAAPSPGSGVIAPDMHHLVLALAITEDYEAALALATVIDRNWQIYWPDDGPVTGAHIFRDFLTYPGTGSLEPGFARVAFVAALRNRDRDLRRAIAMAVDPAWRYWVYRSAALGHIAAGRFAKAVRDTETWPEPASENRRAIKAYHYSRAHVIAMAAVRAARTGHFQDSERALRAMPSVNSAPVTGAVLAKLRAEAGMDVGQAYAAAGDSSAARRSYEYAADAIRDYRLTAGIVLSSDPDLDQRLLASTIARLHRVYPQAPRTAGPTRPDVAAWSSVAIVMSAESPAALAARLVKRDGPSQMPFAYSYAAARVFTYLMRLEEARLRATGRTAAAVP